MMRHIAAVAAITIALGLPAGTRLPGGEPERPRPTVASSAPFSVSSLTASPEPTVPKQVIPVAIRIPSLGIEASILPVGLTADAEMEVPEDIDDVGWYVPTAPSSFDEGSTVMVGHRDGSADPNGVFRRLDTLDENHVVTVIDSSGASHRFRVKSVTSVPDSAFALRATDLFVAKGEPRLILLTCGGEYVREAGGYQSTVVVIATPDDRSEADR